MIGDFLESWGTKEGIHTKDDLLSWIEERTKTLEVDIRKTSLDACSPWFYDKDSGSIVNQNRTFFSICGIRQTLGDKVIAEQPIIVQNEIGFLGIICMRINHVLHFLMQAKIEPGNVNTIQISPTIQATKSNFTQKHGGKKPAYLDYFLKADAKQIIVDQIQSEQSSRFYKKRNRNIIIRLDEDAKIEVLPGYKWMTLGQIKDFIRIDNMVNMDTRTVLSSIPISFMKLDKADESKIKSCFTNESLYNSMIGSADRETLTQIYNQTNNYKMFKDTNAQLSDLYSLSKWSMQDDMFVCDNPYPFRVIFCDIAIEGREVRRWTQPLFEAIGMAVFGLLCCEDAGVLKFLVRTVPEIGCLDLLELGPSVQREAVFNGEEDSVSKLFFDKLIQKQGVLYDTILSEEGGRFYHEQNRNVIIKIEKNDLVSLPEHCFWADYKTLNMLIQVNNCLNIQLRNLLSVLEV